MAPFVASRIELARETSLEAGQAKYKAFFGTPTLQKLYGKYQDEVDAILTTDGHADCIVRS